MAFLFAILTDTRIKVGDNRSEYDDRQLDGLSPFGPLKTQCQYHVIGAFGCIEGSQTDVLRVFRVIAWLRPKDNLSIG